MATKTVIDPELSDNLLKSVYANSLSIESR